MELKPPQGWIVHAPYTVIVSATSTWLDRWANCRIQEKQQPGRIVFDLWDNQFPEPRGRVEIRELSTRLVSIYAPALELEHSKSPTAKRRQINEYNRALMDDIRYRLAVYIQSEIKRAEELSGAKALPSTSADASIEPTPTKLDYLEEKILAAYKSLLPEYAKPTDEAIAMRLPVNFKGLPYTREWVNKKRVGMRKRGIPV